MNSHENFERRSRRRCGSDESAATRESALRTVLRLDGRISLSALETLIHARTAPPRWSSMSANSSSTARRGGGGRRSVHPSRFVTDDLEVLLSTSRSGGWRRAEQLERGSFAGGVGGGGESELDPLVVAAMAAVQSTSWDAKVEIEDAPSGGRALLAPSDPAFDLVRRGSARGRRRRRRQQHQQQQHRGGAPLRVKLDDHIAHMQHRSRGFVPGGTSFTWGSPEARAEARRRRNARRAERRAAGSLSDTSSSESDDHDDRFEAIGALAGMIERRGVGGAADPEWEGRSCPTQLVSLGANAAFARGAWTDAIIWDGDAAQSRNTEAPPLELHRHDTSLLLRRSNAAGRGGAEGVGAVASFEGFDRLWKEFDDQSGQFDQELTGTATRTDSAARRDVSIEGTWRNRAEVRVPSSRHRCDEFEQSFRFTKSDSDCGEDAERANDDASVLTGEYEGIIALPSGGVTDRRGGHTAELQTIVVRHLDLTFTEPLSRTSLSGVTGCGNSDAGGAVRIIGRYNSTTRSFHCIVRHTALEARMPASSFSSTLPNLNASEAMKLARQLRAGNRMMKELHEAGSFIAGWLIRQRRKKNTTDSAAAAASTATNAGSTAMSAATAAIAVTSTATPVETPHVKPIFLSSPQPGVDGSSKLHPTMRKLAYDVLKHVLSHGTSWDKNAGAIRRMQTQWGIAQAFIKASAREQALFEEVMSVVVQASFTAARQRHFDKNQPSTQQRMHWRRMVYRDNVTRAWRISFQWVIDVHENRPHTISGTSLDDWDAHEKMKRVEDRVMERVAALMKIKYGYMMGTPVDGGPYAYEQRSGGKVQCDDNGRDEEVEEEEEEEEEEEREEDEGEDARSFKAATTAKQWCAVPKHFYGPYKRTQHSTLRFKGKKTWLRVHEGGLFMFGGSSGNLFSSHAVATMPTTSGAPAAGNETGHSHHQDHIGPGYVVMIFSFTLPF